MLEVLSCVTIGYLLGNLNPAALMAVVGKVNLRERGTKNLGATNVTLTLGLPRGVIVMVVDMLKAVVSVRIAGFLFPEFAAAGALAGCCCVLGHIFPIFLRFRGGKGLAAFGGMILALDPILFLILLTIGIVLILITDYPISLTFSAASLAPWMSVLRTGSAMRFFPVLLASGLVLYKHRENVGKIRNGTEGKLRPFLRERSGKK